MKPYINARFLNEKDIQDLVDYYVEAKRQERMTYAEIKQALVDSDIAQQDIHAIMRSIDKIFLSEVSNRLDRKKAKEKILFAWLLGLIAAVELSIWLFHQVLKILVAR
jgi:elongation factor P--beta-lysine ligase